jgi:MFS family permease
MNTATALPAPPASLRPGASKRALAINPMVQFVLLIALSFVLRWDTFGDPNLHGDEVFYHTVGLAMHHGAVPYVDVWDRKPFGLFTIFYLIGFLSDQVIAYQIAAALFAAATAFVIARLVQAVAALDTTDESARAPAALGGLLAGMAYLAWLPALQGYGGQSPVWYNLFVAAAMLILVRALPALRQGRAPLSLLGAMLLAGCAITIKQPALFEAAFLGLYAVWTLWRGGMPAPRLARTAVLWAIVGAAPVLALIAGYWLSGHWSEFFHAMVLANLDKPQHWPTALKRLVGITLYMLPLLACAVVGLRRTTGEARRFVAAWLIAAMVGFCAVPQFYLHYAMPLTVPLCLAAAPFLARRPVGIAAFAAMMLMALSFAPWLPGHTEASRAAIERLRAQTLAHIGAGPLMGYDMPPQMYRLTGQPMITPLVFPTHLAQTIERDMSHRNTLAEMQRIIALRPGAAIIASPPRNAPINQETYRLALAYVRANCRLIEVIAVPERERTDDIAVWGDCRARPRVRPRLP